MSNRGRGGDPTESLLWRTATGLALWDVISKKSQETGSFCAGGNLLRTQFGMIGTGPEDPGKKFLSGPSPRLCFSWETGLFLFSFWTWPPRTHLVSGLALA